jgi:hypothetical protein
MKKYERIGLAEIVIGFGGIIYSVCSADSGYIMSGSSALFIEGIIRQTRKERGIEKPLKIAYKAIKTKIKAQYL